MQNKRI